MSSFEEKIKELKRKEIQAKIDYYKSAIDKLFMEIVGARSIEDIDTIEIKKVALERRILELQKELETL